MKTLDPSRPAADKAPHRTGMEGIRRAYRTTLALGALVLLLLLGAVGTSGWLLYRAGVEDWSNDLGMLSAVLAENAAQTFSSAHLVLDGVSADIGQADVHDEAQLIARFSTPQFTSLLNERIHGLPHISAAVLISGTGKVVTLSRKFPSPPINVSDREYFAYHQQSSSSADFLSRPVEGRYDGAPIFFLTRRINDAEGNFLAVIALAMPCAFFDSFFSRISAEKQISIILYRNDYAPLAWSDRTSRSAANLSAATRQQPPDRPVHKLLAEGRPGQREQAYFRGGHWLGVQHKVRDYPLLVEVSVSERIYFGEWLESMSPVIAVAVVSLLGLLTVFVIALRLLRRSAADAKAALRLRDEADRASAAKSRFLAVVSHEIRTPMNGVLGLSELLLDGELPSQQRQYAESIHGAAGGLVRIINDILDLSKIESGRLDLESVPFYPARLAREVVELFEPSAQKKGLRLDAFFHCPPELRLLGDPARLAQVLRNLLSNAIKFTDKGTISLVMFATAQGEGEHRLEFSVGDNGIGIPPEAREHLFEPFSQADSSIARRFGGTGLGLAICKNLVELMGGTIDCQSIPGQSTFFNFDVLCRNAPGVAQPENAASVSPERQQAPPVTASASMPVAEASLASSTPPADAPSDAGKPRILVAEDAEINRQLVRILLGRRGYVPHEVENGHQAYEAVKAQAFDLILMDCMMPVMDGYEASRAIRAHEQENGLPHTAIVALTASAIEGDREHCLAAGMDDYLSKPFTPAALNGMIDTWLLKAGFPKNNE